MGGRTVRRDQRWHRCRGGCRWCVASQTILPRLPYTLHMALRLVRFCVDVFKFHACASLYFMAGSTAAPAKKKRGVAMAVDDRAFTIDTVMREQLQQLFDWIVDPALVCACAPQLPCRCTPILFPHDPLHHPSFRPCLKRV